jgi:polyisoprenoid-binding protein YceI
MMRQSSIVVQIVLSLGLSLGAPSVASAAGFTLQGATKVSFTGKGPAGFKLVGTTEKLSLQDDGQSITFTVSLDSLDTGIELRNRHMKEKYLETAKFPQAVLVVKRSELLVPAKGETKSGQTKAMLTLHGETREVVLQYRAERAADQTKVTSQVKLNFKDFGVAIPSYMGVTVKPDIDVDVVFEVTQA